MTARIPLSIPVIGSHERARLLEAVDSGWIAPAGPQLEAFEALVAERCGRRRAVGVSSGSAALHLALLVAGVGPGDVVICPTLTFIASASAIVHAGAVPLFVDCDSTGNVDPNLVEKAVERAAASGDRVGAILGVDLYGKVADHENLQRIADAYGTVLVVDAAESLGAHREGRPAGSHGTVAAVSFNGNKMATASSGGVVLTDDDSMADRARHLATQAREPVPHYEHHEIGFNFRLSNILAALGLAQVERLDEFLAIRRSHRDRYRALCDRVEGLEILGGEDAGDNCWLTSLVLDPLRIGVDPTALRHVLADDGIEARPVFSPMHLQPAFTDRDRYPREVNGMAESLYLTGLSVPSSPASSSEQINEVCDRIEAAVAAADHPASLSLVPSTGALS